MARPVVPIRVGRVVVRVDVARAGVGTVVHVATAANGANHVTINEVGVKSYFTSALQSRMRKIIAGLFSSRILLEENYVFRNFFLYASAACAAGITWGLRPPLPLARHSPLLDEEKARPVGPRRVRGSDVRVDVARPRIPAVREVAATADSPDHGGIDQVGVVTGVCRS